MRHTILIATLSSVAASVLTTVVIGGSLFGAGTASSASAPVEAEGAVSPGGVEGILQGDLNCDGVVDTHDTLGGLRFLGELDVLQEEPCPDIGTLAAIPGPAGPQGEQGPPGLSDLETVFSNSESNSNTLRFHEVPCPSGKVATGGGGTITAVGTSFVSVTESRPTSDLSKWKVTAAEVNPTTSDWAVRAYAVCATVAE